MMAGVDGATAAELVNAVKRYLYDPARGRDTRLADAVDDLRCRVGDGGVQDAAAGVMDAWVRAAAGLADRRSGQVLCTQRAAWVDSAAREVAHARRVGPDTVLLRAWHAGLVRWRDDPASGPGSGLLDRCRDRGLTGRDLTLAAVGVLVTALDLLGVALELDLADHPDPDRRERTATAAAAVVLTATLGCAATAPA